jgi:tetratricopeptide (TPR) repeat protein
MNEQPGFDLQAAHKYFSVECFNGAWKLLDKAERSAEDDEQMLRLSMASHWHWTQREDATPTNTSVAYWQTARIYAVLGQGQNARRYAQKCLTASQGDDIAPFYLGYAYEALARAELVCGNREQMEKYLAEARRVAQTIPDAEAKQSLLEDLVSIR